MNIAKKNEKKPELLAPAGSFEALEAAIAGGADAVYFGGANFNARMGAKNFAGDTLRDAFRKCHSAGVKTNITLNTLVHAREIDSMLDAARELYLLGADALIVADLGAASLIHKYLPELELHASTQASGHNIYAARELAKLGFSRMVAAREVSLADLQTLCRESPIETELFIHGAICVSQSGQCLASSLIGGRSGNRGECAQPCRLPYKSENGRESYALSLKDICLAEHIPELNLLGAASFKIEGRMKSPDYVYGVTSIYRRLLDENRSATQAELDNLRSLFSRSGFTDGYFTQKISAKMLGIRTEADKRAAKSAINPPSYAKLADARALAFAEGSRRPLDMKLTLRAGLPCRLEASCGDRTVTAIGAIPDAAINQPLTEQALRERLSKLGGTGFVAREVAIELDPGLILPMSAINSLRRDAVERLSDGASANQVAERSITHEIPPYKSEPMRLPFTRTARFARPEQIPERHGFDIAYLPLERFEPGCRANGVILPPVIFDSRADELRSMLKSAHESGIGHVLVSNPGHLEFVRELGMVAHGDFRLNIYSPETAKVLLGMGFTDAIASPELTLGQLRGLGLAAIVYGRVPLMVLEKCAIRDLYGCKLCAERGFLPLIDRKGVKFPLERTWEHRNVLYNSVPIYMADRMGELGKLGQHFIFTVESSCEVESIIAAYESRTSADFAIRRIAK